MWSRTRAAEIRDAESSEYLAVADLLSASVVEDPLSRWLYPDAGERYTRMRRGFLFTARNLVPQYGAVHVAIHRRAPVAAAIWLRLPLRSASWQLRLLQERRDRQLGTPTANEEAAEALTSDAAPQRPHWHLMAFGVAAGSRGRGRGRALLDFGLAGADTDRLPTHLETTEPANVGFYSSAGFAVVAEVDLPDDGPRSHVMCREVASRR